MTTDVHAFISDLGGGVFEEKVSRVLSDVAGAVIDNNKQGKVTLEFSISQIGAGFQVAVAHKLSYVQPTMHGKISEDNTTDTVMHIGTGGKMTLFPEDQHQLFDKRGNINEKEEVLK